MELAYWPDNQTSIIDPRSRLVKRETLLRSSRSSKANPSARTGGQYVFGCIVDDDQTCTTCLRTTFNPGALSDVATSMLCNSAIAATIARPSPVLDGVDGLSSPAS
jgi:hypothetical protein